MEIVAGRGKARSGVAGHGGGRAWKSWHGKVGWGMAGLGMEIVAWRGKAWPGEVRHGEAWKARLGVVRLGRLGEARHGSN